MKYCDIIMLGKIMQKKLLVVLSSLLLIISLTSCTNSKARITTTVYPVAYLVKYLAGDLVDVQYLSSNDFICNSKVVENYQNILKNTDLLLYIGELEPYFDIYEDILNDYHFEKINLASLSAIYNFKRYSYVDAGGITVVREEDYYDDPLFKGEDTFKKDPFIWLDPLAMSSMAATIKQWLQGYYPESEIVIENNFKTLQEKLVRLDLEYQNLKELKDAKFVTVAPTFGNWQKSYGIVVDPLIISKYGVLPTDEQYEYLKKYIKTNKIKYIVNDRTLNEEMAELYNRIKTELSLKEIKLSSLSILSQEDLDDNKDYMTIMLENLNALEKAFQ